MRALGKDRERTQRWRAQPAGLFWSFDDLHIDEARHICRQAISERGGGWLTAAETSAVLQSVGVPVAASALAHSAGGSRRRSPRLIGFPVAAKLASASVQHKTELGGVRLNLATPDAVRAAFAEILVGCLQAHRQRSGGRRAHPGDGARWNRDARRASPHDPVFGPLVGFGMGGIDVEVLRDVRFRVAPLTDRDADEILHEIRGIRLLQGHRGRPPADLEALREILLRVSRLAEEIREIVELDLNPVMVLPAGQGMPCR